MTPALQSWQDHARYGFNIPVRSHYGRMEMLGASATELQEIAWVTYLGNVYDREENTA